MAVYEGTEYSSLRRWRLLSRWSWHFHPATEWRPVSVHNIEPTQSTKADGKVKRRANATSPMEVTRSRCLAMVLQLNLNQKSSLPLNSRSLRCHVSPWLSQSDLHCFVSPTIPFPIYCLVVILVKISSRFTNPLMVSPRGIDQWGRVPQSHGYVQIRR